MPMVPPEYLPLFKAWLAVGQLLQLIWAAVMVGGVLLSLLVFLQAQRHLDPLRLRSARDLLARVLSNKLFGLMFWLLAALNLFAAHWVYRPQFFTPPFWMAVLVLLALALLLLFLYQQLINRPQPGSVVPLAVGAAGLALLLAVLSLLACAEAALLKPEYWPYLNHNPLLFLSWNGLARFLLILCLALPLTGTLLLLRADLAAHPKQLPDYQHYLSCRGGVLALLGVLLLPSGLVFDLLTLPVIARSLVGFLLPVVSLSLALLLCLGLCRRLREGQSPRGEPLLAAVGLIFLLIGLGDFLAREQVLADGTAIWRQASAADPIALEVAAPDQQLLVRGEQIFQSRCTLCHRFDSRLVGPPLGEVLPNYRGRSDALQQFIRQPVKRNPDYPEMPNLGLQQEEAAAVAAYLLERLKQH